MIARALLAALVLTAAAPGLAQELSLIGTWEIVEAQPAPWVEEGKRAAAMAEGKRLLKQVVTFTPKEVVSRHKALACRRAEYEVTDYEADAIFQGNLPEPNPTAHALRLGFKRGEIPGVDLRCSTGVYSYHFRDRNTALTAFSNVIYTMKRM